MFPKSPTVILKMSLSFYTCTLQVQYITTYNVPCIPLGIKLNLKVLSRNISGYTTGSSDAWLPASKTEVVKYSAVFSSDATK